MVQGTGWKDTALGQMLCRFSCISFLNQCNQMESRPEFYMRFNHCQIIRSPHQRFEFNSVSCCHSFNELTQLPWELRKWRMLTHLKLNRNDISFLHKSFSTMFNQLEVLEVIQLQTSFAISASDVKHSYFQNLKTIHFDDVSEEPPTGRYRRVSELIFETSFTQGTGRQYTHIRWLKYLLFNSSMSLYVYNCCSIKV